MPLRDTPQHINRALAEYDPELELRWEDREGCWYFYYQGRKAFAYYHLDGRIAMFPVESEILEIIRRADAKTGRSPYAELKAAERLRRDRKRREEKERRQALAEAGEEAGERADVHRRGGARPFFEMSDNPENTKEVINNADSTEHKAS